MVALTFVQRLVSESEKIDCKSDVMFTRLKQIKGKENCVKGR